MIGLVEAAVVVGAGLATPLATGWSWLTVLEGRAGPGRPLPERWVTAWLLGYGWIGSSLVALASLGVPLTGTTVWPVVLVPLLVLPFHYRRSRRASHARLERDARPGRPGRRSVGLVRIALVLLAAYFVTRAVPECFNTPLKAHDAIGIWGVKALAIFHDRGLDPAFFTLDRDAPLHPDYPLLVPMNGAWLLLNLGAADERLLKTPALLFWVSMLVILWRSGSSRAGPIIAPVVATAFALTHYVYQHALFVTADLFVGVFVLRALLGLVRHATRGDSGELRLAAVFLALATATKNEGWAALVAGGLLVLAGPGLRALARAPGRRIAAVVGLGALALAVNGPWLWFRWRHGLYSDLMHGTFVHGYDSTRGPAMGPARIPYVLVRALEMAYREPLDRVWNGFWIVAAPVALAALVCWRSSSIGTRMLLAFLLLMVAAYTTAFCISPHDIVWHLDTAVPRLLLQLSLPMAALILSVMGDFRPRPPSATIEAMDPANRTDRD